MQAKIVKDLRVENESLKQEIQRLVTRVESIERNVVLGFATVDFDLTKVQVDYRRPSKREWTQTFEISLHGLKFAVSLGCLVILSMPLESS